MPTKKRPNSHDEATEDNGEIDSRSRRQNPRLSSTIEADKHRRLEKPKMIQEDIYKPSSTPMQPLRPHHRPAFISEGARPSKADQRPASEHQQRPRVATQPSPNSFPYSNPPEFFDVPPWLPDAIPPADGEMSYWKTEHAAFIKSDAGLDNADWIGKRPLGSGTFGTAGLWERRDANNVVTEQMVIKESKTVPIERWTGKVPEEAKMMRRMNQAGCQAVPDLIAYKRYVHVRKHRIYMEFCPYGDLAMLNLIYKRFRTYLPEPFLWHTFNNLVQVAVTMKDGPEGSRWGYEIVHRDLKPANIFLSLEDEDSGFPSCPVAKVGDWGLATKIKQGDHNNPIGLRDAGTKAYYAPEQRLPCTRDALVDQQARHLDGSAPLPKLSAHTNVWGIGAIMFELLTHEAVAYYLDDDGWTVNEVFVDIPNFRNPKYSSALTELIKLCLMPDPWDRPSMEELELRIGARCRTIVDEYDADPSLHERDRLYYKGSEINKMPPGNWNYWYPGIEFVPKPSEPPDSQQIENPFTTPIIYPPFPTSDLDGPENEGEAQEGDGNVEDEEDEEDERSQSSDDSDDSDVRRRMAIKKLPGT